jgi:hypothetical protein
MALCFDTISVVFLNHQVGLGDREDTGPPAKIFRPMINRDAMVDPNSSDHVVAITELREQVATLQKQLTVKDNQLLAKEKQVSQKKPQKPPVVVVFFLVETATAVFGNCCTHSHILAYSTPTDHRAQSRPIPHGPGASRQDQDDSEGTRSQGGHSTGTYQNIPEGSGHAEQGQ